ncbi:hypothetical protein P5P86_17585 [Nocardioides sp. BP30]|uniref:Ig-like domain repeat protein n=1 Tax=Nocardioides sp. BP30 TaxID=3036374 RepID=UPI0024686698|nr:hypothetical protein [Nocardioides sp. BP30]WGL51758.1 hypothetical protein P5P86_17585 [Nocardioides sp. BP30]
MKKLYGGIAAAALVATGIACGAGSAGAVAPTWPVSLGFTPDSRVSSVVSTDGTAVYTIGFDSADRTRFDVATTLLATGATTTQTLTLTPVGDATIAAVDSAAVSPTGQIVISAAQNGPSGYSDGVWTAKVGDTEALETLSDLNGAGLIAISRNGEHVALPVIDDQGTGAELYTFAPSSSVASSVPLGEPGDFLTPSGVAVTDSGTAFFAGVEYATDGDDAGTPQLWTAADGGAASVRKLAGPPNAVTLAGSRVVVAERDDQSEDGSTPIQVFDATDGEPVTGRIPVGATALAASTSGDTVWASDGGSIVRVDLDELTSYSDTNPAPSAYPGYSVAALVSGDDALYGVDAPYDPESGAPQPARLFSLGTPAPISDATLTDYNQADQDSPGLLVNWTDPADATGLSYLVTATDQAAPHDSVTVSGNSGGVFLDSSSGIVVGHHYDVSVRTFNGGYLSDAVAALPSLPDATVSVAGDTSVGSTLTASVTGWDAKVTKSYQWETVTDDNDGNTVYTAIKDQTNATLVIGAGLLDKELAVQVTGTADGFAPTQAVSDTYGPVTPAVVKLPALSGQGHVSVSGSGTVGSVLTAHVTGTWPATATLSYQWIYNGGQYGGAIDGATKATFTPTQDLAGLNVGVIVTASLPGHESATATSATTLVRATVGSIKATKVKAGAKKLTLTLSGVSTVPGKVKVYDGKKLIGTATVKNGKVVVKLKKKLAKGKHKVTVKYAGSSSVAKFTKSVTVKVK